MRKKTDVEMERARVVKVTRALIRLRKSLEADRLINEMLPDSLAEFDAALQNGELKTYKLEAKVFDVLDE